MNRRAFLGSLAAAFALDPERALWVPGQKTISIPAEWKPQEHVVRVEYLLPRLCSITEHAETLDAALSQIARSLTHFIGGKRHEFVPLHFEPPADLQARLGLSVSSIGCIPTAGWPLFGPKGPELRATQWMSKNIYEPRECWMRLECKVRV